MKQVVLNFAAGLPAAGFTKVGVTLTDAAGKISVLTPIDAAKFKTDSVKLVDGSYTYTLPSLAMAVGQGKADITPMNAAGAAVGSVQTFAFTVSLQDGDFQPSFTGAT